MDGNWNRSRHGIWKRKDLWVTAERVGGHWRLYLRHSGGYQEHLLTEKTLKRCRDYADTHYPINEVKP